MSYHLGTYCCTYIVLQYLLERADGEDQYERRERGPAAGGAHVGDLLQKRDHQEEAVGVAPELLEQEQRDERYHAKGEKWNLVRIVQSNNAAERGQNYRYR